MESERARALADGNSIPMLGLGVWQVDDSRECVHAVRWALELGYRHIDTAQAYGNEASVGGATRERRATRGDLRHDEVLPGARRSGGRGEREPATTRPRLRRPLHHPLAGGRSDSGPGLGMERARELGHARSIGVSNFDVDEIDTLVQSADQPPVVNQVLFNPFAYREHLLEESGDRCRRRGVQPTRHGARTLTTDRGPDRHPP